MISLAFTFLMVYCGFKAVGAYFNLKSFDRREELRRRRSQQWHDSLNSTDSSASTDASRDKPASPIN